MSECGWILPKKKKWMMMFAGLHSKMLSGHEWICSHVKLCPHITDKEEEKEDTVEEDTDSYQFTHVCTNGKKGAANMESRLRPAILVYCKDTPKRQVSALVSSANAASLSQAV